MHKTKKWLHKGIRLSLPAVLVGLILSVGACRDRYRQEARELMDKGDYKAAVEFFKKKMTEHPDDPWLHNEYGFALRKIKLYRHAESQYREAIRLKHDYPEAHYNLGSLLTELGYHDEAVKEFGIAIEQKPDYSKAYNNRGQAFLKLGFFDKAIQDFEKAGQMEPDNPVYKKNIDIAREYKEKFGEKTDESLQEGSTVEQGE
jgi:tetratricopeptide (TPR) repeat protein